MRTLILAAAFLMACQPEPCEYRPPTLVPADGAPYYYCGEDEWEQYDLVILDVYSDHILIQCVCSDWAKDEWTP